MKKKVYHYKRTPLALAPDALVKAINKYSKNWEAKLISKQEELPKDGSLVHFHNQFLAYSGPKLIQYHSEPQNRGCMPPNEFAQHPDLPKYQLVISQYHATLDEYKDCKVVRNVIDFLDPLFAPIQPTSHLITYSPSTKLKINEWFDKGYEETERILKGLGCEFDIIHGVPYEECIRRKARGSIHIDECVTGSSESKTLLTPSPNALSITLISLTIFSKA